MIDTLVLENFKRHAATAVPLSPLTVLVGPNGSGKTSVLEALHLLGELYEKAPDEVFSGSKRIDAISRSKANVATFGLEVVGTKDQEPRRIRFDAERVPSATASTGALNSQNPHWQLSLRHGAELGNHYALGSTLLERAMLGHRALPWWPHLADATLVKFDPRELRQASLATPTADIAEDGTMLATTIANMKLADDDRIEQISEQLRSIVPQFRRLRVTPTTIEHSRRAPAGGYALSFDMDSGSNIAAEHISEGTIIVLALVTLLHSNRRPRLLLLDDVHEALHPRAQIRLMEMLAKLTTGPDAVQIIATTHSPYIVDCVDPSAVIAFAAKPDGTAAAKRLSEHPDAERLRGTVTAGQLWTLDDEQHWVLGEA